MKKEETKEFEELSLKVFGRKHTWRKLTTRGIVAGFDRELPHVRRRIPLSKEQAMQYMLKTLEMQTKAVKDLEDKNV